VTRIDNQEGQIGLLISLKCQSLQASRVAKFESQNYPELGIYESEATDGYIFVGSSEDQMSNNFHSSNYLCRTVDTQLRDFLDAERQVKVEDIVCESCDKSVGCPTCKQVNHPASVQ
jgi:hypothetical protein